MNSLFLLSKVFLGLAVGAAFSFILNFDVSPAFSREWSTEQLAFSFKFLDFLKWNSKKTNIPQTKVIITPIPRPVVTPQPKSSENIFIPKTVPLHQPSLFYQQTIKKPMAVPTPSVMNPVPSHGESTGSRDLSVRFKSAEREITVLYGDKNIISPEHYSRLNNSLNDLEQKDYQLTEISRLRKMLEALDPTGVKATGSLATPVPSNRCENISRPVLVADITDLSKIQSIGAPGAPSSEGPKGHSFINTEHQRVPVYAPVEAVLESGAYYTGGDGARQYILNFRIKNICDWVFKFDHLDEPVDKIRNVFPSIPRPTEDTRSESSTAEVSLVAGELVGYTKGTSQAGNWDFGLYNMKEEGQLAKYGSYGMHRNAVCWVDYYSPEKEPIYRRLLNGTKIVCDY